MSLRHVFCFVLVVLLCACQRETIAPAARRAAPTATTSTAPPPPVDARGKTANAAIPLVPDVLTRAALGTKLGPDGAVAGESKSFAAGDPIYLSLWIRESPEGLVVAARWLDADGKEIVLTEKKAAGAKVVTLKLDRKLAKGQYLVEGRWGGNVVTERAFEIR
jgi:hypothetical protein